MNGDQKVMAVAIRAAVVNMRRLLREKRRWTKLRTNKLLADGEYAYCLTGAGAKAVLSLGLDMNHEVAVYNKLHELIREAILREFPYTMGKGSIPVWNDMKSRKYAQIRAVLDRMSKIVRRRYKISTDGA